MAVLGWSREAFPFFSSNLSNPNGQSNVLSGRQSHRNGKIQPRSRSFARAGKASLVALLLLTPHIALAQLAPNSNYDGQDLSNQNFTGQDGSNSSFIGTDLMDALLTSTKPRSTAVYSGNRVSGPRRISRRSRAA
jgi:uncharacterized protein YjbI with pentapeptide repeats